MSESLRTRVTRVIAGGAHALLDKIENVAPVVVLEQSVRELEQVTDEVRAELGLIVANRHLTQQQHLKLNKEHDTIGAALVTAIADKRDDLAKPAIARQIDIEAQLPILESSLNELSLQDKELSGFIDALMGKKREMQRAISDFEASRRVSESNANGKSALVGAEAKIQSVQSSFDRTYQRQTGLNPNAQAASLQQSAKLTELTQLVIDNKINERLAALKAAQ
jgi:phage shock protein A